MKILFYIEQYPIRETFIQHTWIINKLLNMITDEYIRKRSTNPLGEIKIFTNKHQRHLVNQGMLNSLQSFIVNATEEEEDQISSYKNTWDEEAILTWKALMNGEGPFSEITLSMIERVYNEEYAFDAVVYWGTNGAIKNFTSKYNIPSVSMELGCTRSPFMKTVYFDFNGVNGNSYTKFIDNNIICNKLSIDDLKTFVDVKLDFKINWEGLYKFVDSKYSKELYEDTSKNILIPLQMTDDSNIINFTKYPSMYEFLAEIIHKLTTAGYKCFIKPHPLAMKDSTLEYIKNDYSKCYTFVEQNNSVYWIDDIANSSDYLAFLNLFKAVCVINSSLGFESLFLKKIVIPFGFSPYNINGLLPTLEDFIHDNIKYDKYLVDIEKILNIVLFHYLVDENEAFEFSNFIQNIKYNIELSRLQGSEEFSNFIINHSREKTYFKFKDYKDKKQLLLRELNTSNKTLKNTNSKLFEKYRNSGLEKKMQYVKKIPLLSSSLLYVKNNILKWKAEYV